MTNSEIDKVETKSGYLTGPEREDFITWVGQSWRGLDVEIIHNAFRKARFLEPIIKNGPMVYFSDEVIKVIDDNEEIDIENPYLDEFEQQYWDNSELIHE